MLTKNTFLIRRARFNYWKSTWSSASSFLKCSASVNPCKSVIEKMWVPRRPSLSLLEKIIIRHTLHFTKRNYSSDSQQGRDWKDVFRDGRQSSSTTWPAPTVCTLKRDKLQRFCVDWQKVMGVTKPGSCSLSRTHGCFKSYGKTAVFCVTVPITGHWQAKAKQTNPI